MKEQLKNLVDIFNVLGVHKNQQLYVDDAFIEEFKRQFSSNSKSGFIPTIYIDQYTITFNIKN